MGWISIDRKILDHWIYKKSKPFCKFAAWIDLIMFVFYEDSKEPIAGQLQVTQRGSRWTSVKELANRWGWSSHRTRLFLDTLQADQMVELKGTPSGTLVTVVNYGVYQHQGRTKGQTKGTTKGTTKDTTKGEPRATDKQVNKNNKEKKKINKKEMPTFFEWIASHEAPFESVEQRNKEWDDFRAQFEEDG